MARPAHDRQVVIMDESELKKMVVRGVRLTEDGDAYAESDGRRMAIKGDSLVLSVPGYSPFSLALHTELGRSPAVQVVWGQGPNVFVRIARHRTNCTPPQPYFTTLHIDAAAGRVLQSVDADLISVATLLNAAMQLSELARYELACRMLLSLQPRLKDGPAPTEVMEGGRTEGIEADAEAYLTRDERRDLAEQVHESCSLSILTSPAELVAVEAPDDDDRWGPYWGWGGLAWRAVLDADGGIAIATTTRSKRSTGAALPFRRTWPHDRSQHALELADGFLVGTDAGEWGGRLDFLTRDGNLLATLVDTNTQGVVRIADHIISLHGINHLRERTGSLRFWTRADRQFVLAGEHPLDGGPTCFTVSGNLLWVLTSNGLWKVDGDNVSRVDAVEVVPFNPTSLVVDRTGDIWAGMQHFILHFKRRGDGRFDEEWLKKKGAKAPPLADELTSLGLTP